MINFIDHPDPKPIEEPLKIYKHLDSIRTSYVGKFFNIFDWVFINKLNFEDSEIEYQETVKAKSEEMLNKNETETQFITKLEREDYSVAFLVYTNIWNRKGKRGVNIYWG